MQAEQRASFDINRRLRRIQVLRLLSGLHRPAAERDDGAVVSGNGNHETVPEPIAERPIVSLQRKPALEQHPRREPVVPKARTESIGHCRGIADRHDPGELAADPRSWSCRRATAPTGAASCSANHAAAISCALRKRFSIPLILGIVRGRLGFRHRQTGPLGELTHRLGERHLVVQLHELDDVATPRRSRNT